ncbi:MAG TPA: hypothetical protein VGQ91_01015, partial [Ideonella sp.]|nr:hypothetical protein [Ideonella sp.]
PRGQLDGVEALHKQRSQEFADDGCLTAEYARFMLQHRGDTSAAISLGEQAMKAQCRDDSAREVLGVAYYLVWAQASAQQRNESLNGRVSSCRPDQSCCTF